MATTTRPEDKCKNCSARKWSEQAMVMWKQTSSAVDEMLQDPQEVLHHKGWFYAVTPAVLDENTLNK